MPVGKATPNRWRRGKAVFQITEKNTSICWGCGHYLKKTPLAATVTGTLQGDGYTVDMIHYQSRPRLYVTGNLYRPEHVEPGERLPAVLYLCGHGNVGAKRQ